ncbi:hypothetical protein D7Y23_15805 [Corallococcus sp. AB050B]|nr:hypothetical protein D7Y23_15805 [Corallococcus sp. AB050B]
MTATFQDLKVAPLPRVIRAAMVVSALVWIYHLLLFLPFSLTGDLPSLLRGLLHGLALVVMGLAVVSPGARREPLSRWRWTWVAWLIVAVGWFPLTVLVNAVVGYSPAFWPWWL